MRGGFTYTSEDLREANVVAHRMAGTKGYTYRPRRLVFGRGILGWVVFLALALLIVYTQTHTRSGPVTPTPAPPAATSTNPFLDLLLPFIPWAIVFLFLYFVIFGNLRRTRARQAESMLRPMELDVSAEGVVLTNGPTQTWWQWPAFKRFVETDRQFLLELELNGGWVAIPKRLAADPSDLDSLREMIETNVDAKVGAFPVQTLA